MPESTRPKSRLDGKIEIINGTPTTVEVAVEEGNLALSGLNAGQRNVVVVEDRGSFATLINGAQKYPTFSLTVYMRDLVDGAYNTLFGICTRTGAFAAAAGTLGTATAIPYTVDLRWTVEGTDHGDGSDHVALFEDCRIDDVNLQEGEINTITISGTCYGAITLT